MRACRAVLLVSSLCLANEAAFAGGGQDSGHPGSKVVGVCGDVVSGRPTKAALAVPRRPVTPRPQVTGSWRVATVSPEVAIADPVTNGRRIATAIRKAADGGAQLVVLPELAISAYTAGDLFHTSTLRDGSRRALRDLLEATKDIEAAVVIGIPYEVPNGMFYNAAFVIQKGKVLGAVPKSYLPNYKEFYDERYFQSGVGVSMSVSDPLLGDFVLAADQLFDFGGVLVAVEICEDAWAPLPVSRRASGAGAHIVVNPSASNETIGKAKFRSNMVVDLSSHGGNIIVYSSAGATESTTDVVFGGHAMVARDGVLLKESARFALTEQIMFTDVAFDGLGAGRNVSDNNAFRRVTGAPLRRGPSLPMVVDATRNVPVPKSANALVPDAPVVGADWRRHGYHRVAFSRALKPNDVQAEVTVIDSTTPLSSEALRAAQGGKGFYVVRDPSGGVRVLAGDRPIEASVPRDEGIAVRPLRQYAVGQFRFAVVHGEDEFTDIPQSTWHALTDATTIIVFVDMLDERAARFFEQQSARLNAAFIIVAKNAPAGGARFLALENGNLLAATDAPEGVCDVDTDKLGHERAQNTTFGKARRANIGGSALAELISVPFGGPLQSLSRKYGKMPFVPSEGSELNRRSEEILTQQAVGLARRLMASGTTMASLGVSGGSDSTLAFLVYLKTCKIMGWKPGEHLHALSMPGFGSTARTRAQAIGLGEAAGVPVIEKDIRPASLQTLRDQGHPMWKAIERLPYAGMGGLWRQAGNWTGRPLSPEAYYPYMTRFPELEDVAFENAQARQRTLLLMQHAFVIGTGDMSELALGWATYNADHMSMYNPNTSIPKTLVKHLIRWVAMNEADEKLKHWLLEILDTPVSPELRSPRADGTIAQVTEESVGPYILNDFFLFHYVRNGFSARKIYDLACREFELGTPGVDAFTRDEIKKWIGKFFQRFFAQQYKRTVIPPGPQVGSVSLSSRGVWRMPDEASVRSELDGIETWP